MQFPLFFSNCTLDNIDDREDEEQVFCESKTTFVSPFYTNVSRYSVLEKDEEVEGWLTGRSVGYCIGCPMRKPRENLKEKKRENHSGENYFEIKSS